MVMKKRKRTCIPDIDGSGSDVRLAEASNRVHHTR